MIVPALLTTIARPPRPSAVSTSSSAVERSLILIKPDAFARNLSGEIIARFERKGLRIAALRHMTLDRQTAEELQKAEHLSTVAQDRAEVSATERAAALGWSAPAAAEPPTLERWW